jgi:hypothetical protein
MPRPSSNGQSSTQAQQVISSPPTHRQQTSAQPSSPLLPTYQMETKCNQRTLALQSSRAGSRRQKCPHHPLTCIALPPVHRCNVQCRLYHHLHQDWVHHRILWPHYHLWPQMHVHWPLDGPTTARPYKFKHITSHSLPSHNCHGCQR